MRTLIPVLKPVVKKLKDRNADIRLKKDRYATDLVNSFPKYKVVYR